MKTYSSPSAVNSLVLLLVLSLSTSIVLAGPLAPSNPAAIKARNELAARRAAMALIEAGRTAEAVAQFRQQSLGVDREAAEFAVVQSMIQLSYTFYNQKKLVLARSAAEEAIRLAQRILEIEQNAPRTAALASSLGVIAENIFLDLPAARQFYEIAVSANATDPVSKRRLGEVKEKIENRNRMLAR